MPKTLHDQEAIALLTRIIETADPVLRWLRSSDPLDLKQRTFPVVDYSGPAGLAACALNGARWPGTAAWAELSPAEREDWWLHRVGGLNSLAVSLPAMIGGWVRRIPAIPALSIADQALIVLAVAEENGITSNDDKVALLASALFDRELHPEALPEHAGPDWSDMWKPADPIGAAKALWALATLPRRAENTLAPATKLPTPLQQLSFVPVLGGPACYLGELIALRESAHRARQWLSAHPDMS